MGGFATYVRIYQRYLLPGVIFQSVLIGGGYGTGREIVEFFLAHGALGGLLGLVVTAVAWGLVLALAFEFSRITKSYDYRSFFRALLGPFWRAFEFIYIIIAVLVLSVIGAAAGEMVSNATGAPLYAGAILLLGAIGAIAYSGGEAIEWIFTQWSLLLYIVYGLFVFFVLTGFGGTVVQVLVDGDINAGWQVDGLRYAAYNLVALSAVLFVLPHIETRRQAVLSGLIAGWAGIIPGILVFIALLAQYPDILKAPVPVVMILEGLDISWFSVLFQCVLFGTFIETGGGIIHSVNERIATALGERGAAYPRWARAITAIVMLGAAVFLAKRFGIVDLIAKGYGALSYAYLVIVIIPLFTIGLLRVLKRSGSSETVVG